MKRRKRIFIENEKWSVKKEREHDGLDTYRQRS